MKTYVQLKDSIGFAYVNTENETDGIEVPFGEGDEYIFRLYTNGEWGEKAPLIWFAEINYDGSIIELRKTRFISEVGDNPIITPDIKMTSKWINGEWVQPPTVILHRPEDNASIPKDNAILPEEATDTYSTEGSVDETTQTDSQDTGDPIQ